MEKFLNTLKRRNEHLKFSGKTISCSECEKCVRPLLATRTPKRVKISKSNICPKCFESSSKLLRNEICHRKTNMISCNQRNKLFSRNDNMLQHKKRKH